MRICKEHNATLPYCKYTTTIHRYFGFRRLENWNGLCTLISAYNHYKTIKEHKILHFDLGTWFGAHFDFDVGDYVVDKTGLPLKSEGLNLTTSILNGESRIKMNSLYGGTWWSIEGFDYYRKLVFNASILCFKYEEGFCIEDGEINLFNKPCIETAKQ